MLVVTTENISGSRVTDVKGQVFGVVVRSHGLDGNIEPAAGELGRVDAARGAAGALALRKVR